MCGCNTNCFYPQNNHRAVQRGLAWGRCGSVNGSAGFFSASNAPQNIFVCAQHCMQK